MENITLVISLPLCEKITGMVTVLLGSAGIALGIVRTGPTAIARAVPIPPAAIAKKSRIMSGFL
jgi:hypothetical protein